MSKEESATSPSGIYRRALPLIDLGRRRYHGIDVPDLRRNVERSLETGVLSPFRV